MAVGQNCSNQVVFPHRLQSEFDHIGAKESRILIPEFFAKPKLRENSPSLISEFQGAKKSRNLGISGVCKTSLFSSAF
jgi:hypothetical protein